MSGERFAKDDERFAKNDERFAENDERFAAIAEAFSRTAEKYDRFAEDHPNLRRMRETVYTEVKRWVDPEAGILELNAGTGTDALQLAGRGYRVHAIDIAEGMLSRLRDKVAKEGMADRVGFELRSFTELEKVSGGPYDAVFSDLGGLNCIPDLSVVSEKIPMVLKPGGVVVWVLMPPVCLWELGTAITGNFRYAFRRLRRGGTRAHLEGKYFDVYYFTPRQAREAFGKEFRLLGIKGLSVFAPPAESKNLAMRAPRLYRALVGLDERLAGRKPFWGWGDFYIISLRYEP